ncbi:MAG TPA: adenylate/guanylate cyclase domain-containing protein [Gaiellaceae bacterium]|nr:adenylate/guanylate cyclase domain-containing protein [Gaiellaceae bacterium]
MGEKRLEFGVLGPLEVRCEGVPVSIEGREQRVLLALSLLLAGEVVGEARLIRALWPEPAPADAAGLLAAHVSRLRRTLAAVAGCESSGPRWRPPDYVFELGGADLDLDRFRSLLAEARRLRERKPAVAAACYEQALALWRGPPFSELQSEPLARAEVARLEQLRLEARDGLVETRLAAKQGSETLMLTFSGADAPARPAERERKVVSVLFCDLVGFTAASEAADPEEVEARLTPYYGRVRRRVEAFGGTVEKFIGDAVMAVFGAPVAYEDDTERAVRAGLAILETIADLNESDPALALSVRVGVNTGEALVSVAADLEHGVGLVAGDVVNTAARLESAAPTDTVVVGAATYQATRHVFDYRRLEDVQVKGKSAPLALWRALSPRARFGSDITRTHGTPLVGRELDLMLLRGAYEKAVRERSIRLSTIVGEPGIGKSRLVAELFSELDAGPGLVSWRQGRCLPYGEGITFWALGELVKAQAGIYDSDSPETASAKLEAVLPDRDRPWLRARLLPLLGLVSTPVARQEAFTAWRRFLESIAEQGPAVLVFEDIHWADEPLLSFIEHLADSTEAVPLLLICTARPQLYEAHPTWGAGLPNHTAIRLAPLSEPETTRLLSTLLGRTLLPAKTQQLLLDRSGGNPLYAEEFVRMLADSGSLDARGNVALDSAVPVPGSLQALISARLDTLPRERKRLLQDAAVIGKAFWVGAVAALGHGDDEQAEQALHELARKQLVRRARHSTLEGEAEYGFWHILIRDVAYAQIPRAERADRHRRAAEWLEQKAAGRLEDVAEVIAHHTGEALALAEASGDRTLARTLAPTAARFALLAGERALGLDTDKALKLLARARTLTAEDDPGFPIVLSRWAEAARQSGRHREAVAALERAISLFLEQDDVRHAGEALATLSSVRFMLGEPDHIAAAEQAVSLLEAEPGTELVAALGALAYTQIVAGASAPAVDTAGRAIALAHRLGLPEPGQALGARGVARCFRGDLDGLTEMRRALDLLIGEGRGRDAATLYCNLASVQWLIDGPADALATYEQAQAFAQARGLSEPARWCAEIRAQVLLELGRLDETLDQATAIAPALTAGGDLASLCSMRASEARALAEQGGDDRPAAEEALRLARESDDPLQLAVAATAAAPAHVDAGQIEAARSLLSEIADADIHDDPDRYGLRLPALLRAAFRTGDPELIARLAADVPATLAVQQHALAVAQALSAEAVGDHARAADLHAKAAAAWALFGDVLEHAHALLGEGRCRSAASAPADAPLHLARALFSEMGAAPRVAECERLISATRTEPGLEINGQRPEQRELPMSHPPQSPPPI